MKWTGLRGFFGVSGKRRPSMGAYGLDRRKSETRSLSPQDVNGDVRNAILRAAESGSRQLTP